jgi:hypothetical protein
LKGFGGGEEFETAESTRAGGEAGKLVNHETSHQEWINVAAFAREENFAR